MFKSTPAEQAEQLLHNANLQEFLTFLKQERGFADATIVNRERSLKPFLAWLVAQDVPLATILLSDYSPDPELRSPAFRSLPASRKGSYRCGREARWERGVVDFREGLYQSLDRCRCAGACVGSDAGEVRREESRCEVRWRYARWRSVV